ncbi:MAG: hypothetical protein HY774_29025 [Acidobacteria bacterium]|nr:hypothetical protein [Acidobacteriota bacterium]
MSGRQITRVEIQANGQVIGVLTTPPYSVTYQVPQTEAMIQIEASAVDDGGNHGRATPVSVQVVETDPLTTVIGMVTDVHSTPVSNVPVVLDGLNLMAVTDASGQFRFENVSTLPFGVKLSATINDPATGRRGRSAQVVAVRGGTTELGTIQAAVIRSALLPSLISGLGSGDHSGDNLADVFIGFADQPAAVYQSDGTGNLTPGSTLTLPFSTVRAGTSFRLDSVGGVDILAQPVGTPGTATIVLTDGAGGILSSMPLETGLDRESELIVTGFDSPDFLSRRPVVAFAALTGGTSLTVRVNEGAPDQFSAPIGLPTTPEIPIRSLLVQDVTGDQLADIVGIEEISSTDTRLIVFPRTGTTTFGAPVESSVIIRNGAATVGTVEVTIGTFGSGRNDDVAVLAEDRVRIYSGDGTGSYSLYREILLPENTVGRGIGPQSQIGGTVLAITVSQLDVPLSRMLLLYGEGGETPTTVIPYELSSDVGETRIVIDDLGGSEFGQFDVVVIDGRTLTTFLDLGPPRASE